MAPLSCRCTFHQVSYNPLKCAVFECKKCLKAFFGTPTHFCLATLGGSQHLLGQDGVNGCVATQPFDLEAFEIFEVTRKPPTSADSSLLCGESRTCRPSVLTSDRNAQKILLYYNAFANVVGDASSGAKLAAQRVREITRFSDLKLSLAALKGCLAINRFFSIIWNQWNGWGTRKLDVVGQNCASKNMIYFFRILRRQATDVQASLSLGSNSGTLSWISQGYIDTWPSPPCPYNLWLWCCGDCYNAEGLVKGTLSKFTCLIKTIIYR